ncbi:MAG: hydroxymethylglutaryl-CoA synthase, partial [Bifidobacteriaceae bacterium]|nr:hydroxymethylglutaryl-CoA synthase [Bifidobacteriaceae bacterium]
SYGSGAVGEFFTASLSKGYADNLDRDGHLAKLEHRTKLSVDEYEAVFSDKIPYSAEDYHTDEKYYAGQFVLTDVTGQERHYATR